MGWISTQSDWVQLLNEEGCVAIAWSGRVDVICGCVGRLSKFIKVFCHPDFLRVLNYGTKRGCLYYSVSYPVLTFPSSYEQIVCFTSFLCLPLVGNRSPTNAEKRKRGYFGNWHACSQDKRAVSERCWKYNGIMQYTIAFFGKSAVSHATMWVENP